MSASAVRELGPANYTISSVREIATKIRVISASVVTPCELHPVIESRR